MLSVTTPAPLVDALNAQRGIAGMDLQWFTSIFWNMEINVLDLEHNDMDTGSADFDPHPYRDLCWPRKLEKILHILAPSKIPVRMALVVEIVVFCSFGAKVKETWLIENAETNWQLHYGHNWNIGRRLLVTLHIYCPCSKSRSYSWTPGWFSSHHWCCRLLFSYICHVPQTISSSALACHKSYHIIWAAAVVMILDSNTLHIYSVGAISPLDYFSRRSCHNVEPISFTERILMLDKQTWEEGGERKVAQHRVWRETARGKRVEVVWERRTCVLISQVCGHFEAYIA